MLAQGPSFWQNPKGSLDQLAYLLSKAYRKAALSSYLGSEVLGCCGTCLESQSSASPRTQPYLWAPGQVWPADLRGLACLIARAMDTGFLLLCAFCL